MSISIDREQALRRLPDVTYPAEAAFVAGMIKDSARKVVVLDDDPTGTQTVHDVPVITSWSVRDLERELLDDAPAAYVLTNSRSLGESQATALSGEIATHLRLASEACDRDYVVVSRSDSTLRGHFPAEMDALQCALGRSTDAWILCPFFAEGGRLTIDDVHYVTEGQRLVPAAETPFAADAAFGFANSNLRAWIQEKSAGRITAGQIASLSIADLRGRSPEELGQELVSLPRGSVCILNAATMSDVQAGVAAILVAESQGKRFLYRTAASFVAARAGISPRPPLTCGELTTEEGRGVLIVAGSYVPKTTAQLQHLIEHSRVKAIELDVARLLDATTRDGLLRQSTLSASAALAENHPVVVYTSRTVVQDTGVASLDSGRTISRALVEFVRRLSQRPRVLVAKGGITSSDIATGACGVQRAMVMGHVLPGVPVWRCGPESRYPGMPLVVFPGNVGGDEALTETLSRLST